MCILNCYNYYEVVFYYGIFIMKWYFFMMDLIITKLYFIMVDFYKVKFYYGIFMI